MSQRADYVRLAPRALQILMKQEAYLTQQFTVSKTLPLATWELVKLRISQINQCPFCIDMHSHDALEQGESHERLIGLNAWQGMPFYSQQEQAALGWSEHLTAGKSVDDSTYLQALEVLGEQAIVDLTIAVNAINAWNRIAKAFKPAIGSMR